MSRPEIHVTPRPDGRWQGKKPHAPRASYVYDTKAAALERARTTARRERLELVIHNRNGRISDSDSYGNDSKYIHDNVH